MKVTKHIFLFIVLLLCSNNKVVAFIQQYTVNEENIPVFFTLTEEVPDNSQLIKVTDYIKDRNCDLHKILQKLSQKAREHNANAIKIISSQNESCLQIKAHLLFIDDIEYYRNKDYSILNQENYAVIHLYKMHSSGSSSNLIINLDSSIKIHPRSKTTILFEPGFHELSIDKTAPFSHFYKAGKTYYLRIDTQSNENKTTNKQLLALIGKIEFESITQTNANVYKYTNQNLYDTEKLQKWSLLETELDERMTIQTGNYSALENEEEDEKHYFNFYIGFQGSPFRFKESYISYFPTNPDLIDVDYEFEPKRITGGLKGGVQIGNKIGFIGGEISSFYTSRVSGRGKDEINMFLFNIGTKHHFSEEHTIAFSLGFGHHNIRRNLPSANKLDVSLRNRRYFLNPTIRYEYKFPETLFGIFAEVSYVHLVFNTSTRSGLVYEIELDEPRERDGAEVEHQIIRFNNPNLNFDENSRLNYGDRFNFSIGFFMGLNSKK